MNNILLKIEQLTVDYEGHRALNQVDLAVHHNEFIGIIGPNGGGKTTLARTLLGLVKPTSGQFTFYNKEGQVLSQKPAIGYLPQYAKLDPKFPISLKEVVRSGLPKGLSKQEATLQIKQMIEKVGLLHKYNAHISEMSGGELQRGLLARALVSRPNLLILDEPGTYIDQHYKRVLMQLLDEVKQECAILLVTHDIGTIIRHVDTIACVNQQLHVHKAEDWGEQHLNDVFGCAIEQLNAVRFHK